MEEGGVSSEFIYSYSFITKNFHTLALSITHWGRVMHICTSKLTIIGSDNGLFPERCQAIICTKAGILLIGPLGTNFNEILSEICNIFIQENAFECVICKMVAILSQPQCFNPLHADFFYFQEIWLFLLTAEAGHQHTSIYLSSPPGINPLTEQGNSWQFYSQKFRFWFNLQHIFWRMKYILLRQQYYCDLFNQNYHFHTSCDNIWIDFN